MSRVTKPTRLIGSVHRLFNRSGQTITEPMLHPTPHEYLLEEWENEHGTDAAVKPNPEELGDLPLNLSFHKFDADEGPPRFSVIEEYLALQKVEKVMDSLRKAGAEFTVEGFKKLERDLRFKGTIWDKIIEEHNLHGARTAWIGIAPDIFYNALGDRDCVFGAARDRDVFPDTLLQNWKQNGFAISFNKFQSDLVTNDALFGPELGKKITDYEEDLLKRYRATLKANHGGVVLGFLFFFMGIYTLWWQWQFINYRDLERQRFKMAWRIQDPDAPVTEAKKNMREKHKEFLLTYFDDDDEEEEEEEEEEDDE